MAGLDLWKGILSRRRTLADQSENELRGARLQMEAEQGRIMRQIDEIEKQKAALDAQGRAEPSARKQALLAQRLLQLEAEAKRMEHSLSLVSKQVRIVGGLCFLKQNSRALSGTPLGALLGRMSAAELQTYVDTASVDGSLDLDKLNQVLGIVDGGDKLQQDEEAGRAVSDVVSRWQQEQEEAVSPPPAELGRHEPIGPSSVEVPRKVAPGRATAAPVAAPPPPMHEPEPAAAAPLPPAPPPGPVHEQATSAAIEASLTVTAVQVEPVKEGRPDGRPPPQAPHRPDPWQAPPGSPAHDTVARAPRPERPAEPSPSVDALLPMGTTCQAGGISLALNGCSIGSGGRIDLKFLARNEGGRAVLVRYQNSYFQVSDDLGTQYKQTEMSLLDPKQRHLQPGESYELMSSQYPDAAEEIGQFLGMVPEEAGWLVVRVTQFAGLRNVAWCIPLNPLECIPQTPPPGTPQPVLEGFSANGVAVLLSGYGIGSKGWIDLKFLVRNEGTRAVLARYQNSYFQVSDDLGTQYKQTEMSLLDPKQRHLQPGESYEVTSSQYPDAAEEIGQFLGMVPEEAGWLVVRVTQFAGLRDMVWHIPLQ
jgi:hypothetical protein